MEKPLYIALATAGLHPNAAPLLSPDHALLILTLGIGLIYVELNRPGRIIPGAVGLLATLLVLPPLFIQRPTPAATLLLATAIVILAMGLRRTLHPTAYFVATIALILGFHEIPYISWKTALPCGLILGAGTSILTRIARRARLNKGLDLERARTSRPGAFKS